MAGYYVERSRKKGGFLSRLLLASALAGGAYYAYQNIDLQNPAPQTAPVTIRPSPTQIADAFVNRVMPENALRYKAAYDITEAEKKNLRALIIKYESLSIEAQDAVTYWAENLSGPQKEYLAERIEFHRQYTKTELDAAVAGVGDLEAYAAFQAGTMQLPLLGDRVERTIRNKKFNEKYGRMSHEQAEVLAARYMKVMNSRGAQHALGTDYFVKVALEQSTIIDYLTDSLAAGKRGWSSYKWHRDEAIRIATLNVNAPAKPAPALPQP